mgnify:CR=1 FL=1
MGSGLLCEQRPHTCLFKLAHNITENQQLREQTNIVFSSRTMDSPKTVFPPYLYSSRRVGYINIHDNHFCQRFSPPISFHHILLFPSFCGIIKYLFKSHCLVLIILYLFTFVYTKTLFMCIYAHPRSHAVGELFSPLPESSTTRIWDVGGRLAMS